jgi:hypothetical protein
VCGDEFEPPRGQLVTFAPRESDRQWRRRAAGSGFVGHPPNVEWFCGVHAKAASALASSTIDLALSELRSAVTDPSSDPEIVRVPIAPTEIGDLQRLLRDLLPALVGDDAAVATTTSERTWSPMDGSTPPNCPYNDIDTTTMTGPWGLAELIWDCAMWNDEDAARRTVTLVDKPTRGERCSLSATVGTGFEGSEGSRALEVLVLGRPGDAMRALIDQLALASS